MSTWNYLIACVSTTIFVFGSLNPTIPNTLRFNYYYCLPALVTCLAHLPTTHNEHFTCLTVPLICLGLVP